MAPLAPLRHFSYVLRGFKKQSVFSSRKIFHNGSFWGNDSREGFWNEGSHPYIAWFTLPHPSNREKNCVNLGLFYRDLPLSVSTLRRGNDLGMSRAPKRRHRSAYHQLRSRDIVKKVAFEIKRANPPTQRQLATRHGVSASSINRILSENFGR